MMKENAKLPGNVEYLENGNISVRKRAWKWKAILRKKYDPRNWLVLDMLMFEIMLMEYSVDHILKAVGNMET